MKCPHCEKQLDEQAILRQVKDDLGLRIFEAGPLAGGEVGSAARVIAEVADELRLAPCSVRVSMGDAMRAFLDEIILPQLAPEDRP